MAASLRWCGAGKSGKPSARLMAPHLSARWDSSWIGDASSLPLALDTFLSIVLFIPLVSVDSVLGVSAVVNFVLLVSLHYLFIHSPSSCVLGIQMPVVLQKSPLYKVLSVTFYSLHFFEVVARLLQFFFFFLCVIYIYYII